MPALADEHVLPSHAMDFVHLSVDDAVPHPVGVKKPVVDSVEVAGADGPGDTGGMEHRRVSHQGVRLEKIVGDRREKHVLRAFHIDRELDLGPRIDLFELFLEKLTGVLHGGDRDCGGILSIPLELLPGGNNKCFGSDADLSQDPSGQVGDKAMIDTHGTGIFASLTRRTSVRGFRQPVDVLVGEAEVVEEPSFHLSRQSEVPSIHFEQELRPVARNILRVSRRLIHLTRSGADRALGSATHIGSRTGP